MQLKLNLNLTELIPQMFNHFKIIQRGDSFKSVARHIKTLLLKCNPYIKRKKKRFCGIQLRAFET